MDRWLANCCCRSSFHPGDNAELTSGGVHDHGASPLFFSDLCSAGSIAASGNQSAIRQQHTLLETCVAARQQAKGFDFASRLTTRTKEYAFPQPTDLVIPGGRIERSSLALEALLAYFPPSRSERLVAGYTDAAHRLVAMEVLAIGSLGTVCAEARSLFASALTLDARGIILAHNHPSGDPRPSNADLTATKRVKAMAEQLGIELIDHLIFTDESAYSIRRGAMI